MHDNPRATEDEQELAHRDDDRLEEEESMRGGEFHDPDEERDKARRDRDE
ncbi:MAG TPA: hypothetical protein VFJ77_02645 [Gaiellaceae bacterium]|nr:hypothetical protein [Gaiellaceae bacterium]